MTELEKAKDEVFRAAIRWGNGVGTENADKGVTNPNAYLLYAICHYEKLLEIESDPVKKFLKYAEEVFSYKTRDVINYAEYSELLAAALKHAGLEK